MIRKGDSSEPEGTINGSVQEGAEPSEEVSSTPRSSARQCPGCGRAGRLYRTPKGLRCMNCVRRADSGGLGFIVT